MKIKIQNFRDQEIRIQLEPHGDFHLLHKGEFLLLELDKQKDGLPIDLAIYEENELMLIENNDVFIDTILRKGQRKCGLAQRV